MNFNDYKMSLFEYKKNLNIYKTINNKKKIYMKYGIEVKNINIRRLFNFLTMIVKS